MKLLLLFFLIPIIASPFLGTCVKIKPPIPQNIKDACLNAGNKQEKRTCLNDKLKEYCKDESNIDTITCKVVRLKTLIPDSISGNVFY